MGRKHSRLTAVVAGILVCVAAVGTRGSSVTAERVTFRGHGIELSGVMYKPRGYDQDTGPVGVPGSTGRVRYSAVVMMHGCCGIWSERLVGAMNRDGTPNLQNEDGRPVPLVFAAYGRGENRD